VTEASVSAVPAGASAAGGTRSPQARRGRLAAALGSLSETVDRLSELSERGYQNPYKAVEWPDSLDPEGGWYSSPELLSLYGTPMFERLGEPARRRLAFYEAVNFFSLNIHGEKSLMQGIAARLYRKDLVGVAPYLHHFLDEENKHSIYFGRFCTRYASIYKTRQMEFGKASDRDLEDFLFFTKVLIFEEIVDHYNRMQAKDQRLHPLARFINHNHHTEETRHLAFGRRLVAALWHACAPDWDAEIKRDLRAYLAQFFVASWHEYYNPDVYADVGLADPWQTAEDAWSAEVQRRHRRTASLRCVRFLISANILDREPPDVF
jgi:para-aminobenzoate N-oxygenase AurF